MSLLLLLHKEHCVGVRTLSAGCGVNTMFLILFGPAHCRQLVAEVTELRAGKENQGTSADTSRSVSLLKRLRIKKTKDRSALSKHGTLHGQQCCLHLRSCMFTNFEDTTGPVANQQTVQLPFHVSSLCSLC